MAKKEVTNHYLVNHAMPALQYLAGNQVVLNQFKNWYAIKKNMLRIGNALEEFNASHKEIVEKYSVDGKVDESKQEEADSVFRDLLNEKVTVDFYEMDMYYLDLPAKVLGEDNKTVERSPEIEMPKIADIIGLIIVDKDEDIPQAVESTEMNVVEDKKEEEVTPEQQKFAQDLIDSGHA